MHCQPRSSPTGQSTPSGHSDREPIRRVPKLEPRWPHSSEPLPTAVIVEVLIADYTRRDVTRGQRAIQPLVADLCPVLESVRRGSSIGLVLQGILSAEPHLFTAIHFHRMAVSGGLTAPFAGGYPGLIVAGPHINAIHPGLHYGEREVGRVDLEDFTRLKVLHGEFEDALIQFGLNGVVAHIGEGQAAFRVHAKNALPTFSSTREFLSVQMRSDVVRDDSSLQQPSR